MTTTRATGPTISTNPDPDGAGLEPPATGAVGARGLAFLDLQRRTCNAPGLTMLVGVPLMKLTTLSKAELKYIS